MGRTKRGVQSGQFDGRYRRDRDNHELGPNAWDGDMNGARVEVILAWVGAVHLPELEEVAAA